MNHSTNSLTKKKTVKFYEDEPSVRSHDSKLLSKKTRSVKTLETKKLVKHNFRPDKPREYSPSPLRVQDNFEISLRSSISNS